MNHRFLLPVVLVMLLAACTLIDGPLIADGEQATILRSGEVYESRFNPGSPRNGAHQSRSLFAFKGLPGEQVEVVLTTDDFTPSLLGGSLRSGSLHPLDRAMGVGPGHPVRIVGEVGADGVYLFRAMAGEEGDGGAFSIEVNVFPPFVGNVFEEPERIPSISQGSLHRGALAPGQPQTSRGSYFHVFRVVANPGDELLFVMESEEVDAYLSWGVAEDGDFRLLAVDDDSAGGLNAGLKVTVGEEGPYFILAHSFGAREVGDMDSSFKRPLGGGGKVGRGVWPSKLSKSRGCRARP